MNQERIDELAEWTKKSFDNIKAMNNGERITVTCCMCQHSRNMLNNPGVRHCPQSLTCIDCKTEPVITESRLKNILDILTTPLLDEALIILNDLENTNGFLDKGEKQ